MFFSFCGSNPLSYAAILTAADVFFLTQLSSRRTDVRWRDVAIAATLNKSGGKEKNHLFFAVFFFYFFLKNEFMFSKSGSDSVESVDDNGSADVDWRHLKPDKHID